MVSVWTVQTLTQAGNLRSNLQPFYRMLPELQSFLSSTKQDYFLQLWKRVAEAADGSCFFSLMLLTAQDFTLYWRRKKRDFYPDHLVLKGIFPHQIQKEEKEFLNCELFSTLFKVNSRKHQKTVNNLVLGPTERVELSLQGWVNRKKTTHKNSLEGTVWNRMLEWLTAACLVMETA